MPFIEQVPSPSSPPPAIYDTSEHNKENIPPFDFINQFHLPNIIPKFDARFKTFDQYWNYWNRCLTLELCDPDFAMFDGAYCHHQLILRQKEGLLTMHKQLDTQLKELNTQDQVQRNNVELLLPKLGAKGLAVCITDTLGRPEGNPHFPTLFPSGICLSATSQLPLPLLLWTPYFLSYPSDFLLSPPLPYVSLSPHGFLLTLPFALWPFLYLALTRFHESHL